MQPAAWSALGIDAVVVGQVTQNPDGSYQVAYQLVDTGGAPGTTLAQGSFKVTKQYLRYAAHAASDAVFEKLTGIKGAFRTRIAYVVQKKRRPVPLRTARVRLRWLQPVPGSPFLPAADVPGLVSGRF